MFSKAHWYIVLAYACLASNDALAHARWFVDDTQIVLRPQFQWDQLGTTILFVALVALIVALALELASCQFSWLHRLIAQPIRLPTVPLWRLLSVVFGTTLILSSMARVFVATNLPAGSGPTVQTMAFLQILTGAMFILQTRLLVASLIVIVVLPLYCMLAYSFGHAVDYAIELIAIGFAFNRMAPALSHWDLRLCNTILRYLPTGFSLRVECPNRQYDLGWLSALKSTKRRLTTTALAEREASAFSILRVMFGLQLVVLAAHDKLLEPGVTLSFVDKYSFVNFPALMGVSGFTNMHFVIGSGLAEIVFGTLLVANVAARPVCAVLLFLFTTTSFLFGIDELVGHLPIIAILLVLMVPGSGRPLNEHRLGRWELGTLTSAGTGMLFLVVGFAGNATLPPADVVRLNTSIAVPAALYNRFIVSTAPQRIVSDPKIREANDAVRKTLARSKEGIAVNKDVLAADLLALSLHYEIAYGRDAASLWLRYAHLTASCSHDNLQFFRDLVSGGAWSDALIRAPQDLLAELMPIARVSASALMKQGAVDMRDPGTWTSVGQTAPSTGPDYVHTHTLASISRIIQAAARDVAP